MSWCYAIMRHTYKCPTTKQNRVYYALHEIYSPKFMGTKKKIGWTKESITLSAETVSELKAKLKLMQKDISKNPIFEYGTGKIIKRREK